MKIKHKMTGSSRKQDTAKSPKDYAEMMSSKYFLKRRLDSVVLLQSSWEKTPRLMIYDTDYVDDDDDDIYCWHSI